MPALRSDECYRLVKSIDISQTLRVLDKLEFVGTGNVFSCGISIPSSFVTKPGSQAPTELMQLVASLGLGGTHARMFCRKLGPRQGIAPHIDERKEAWAPDGTEWRRFQVPLVSHPAIIMRWPDDGVEVHLAPGNLYEVRVDRMHEVVNDADCERIHVQIDQLNATI